ncbi:unnamed protein product, partial [Owenia fusiformis]
DKPSPPQNLEVLGMTAETGDIKWEPSEDDGGSPITGYIVEKRDITRTSWQQVETTTDLSCTIPKLLEGKDYLFRVSAENKYGVSDPTSITEAVKAKNPF